MARLKFGTGIKRAAIQEQVEEPTLMDIVESEPIEDVIEPDIQIVEVIREVPVEIIIEKEVPGQVVYQQVEVVREVPVEVVVEKQVIVEVIRDVISFDNSRIEALEKELANVYALKQNEEKRNKTLKIALVVTYAIVIIGALLV